MVEASSIAGLVDISRRVKRVEGVKGVGGCN